MERINAWVQIRGNAVRFVKQVTIRHFLFGWLVLALIVLGASDQALLGSEDYFLFLPLCAFAVVLFCSKSFSPRDWLLRENRANALFALLLAALTLLMLPITRFLSGPMFSLEGMQIVWWNYAWQRMLYFAWNWTGLLVAVVLSVFGCWYALFTLCLSPTEETASPLAIEKPLFCGMYRWTFLIAAVAFVCVYSAAPGLFDQYDQAAIWQNARSGTFTDAHPVTYQLFVRLCTLILPTRRMVSLVLLGMWIYSSNLAIGILQPLHPSAGKWYAILTCIAFIPMLLLSTLVKDVPYGIALFALGLQILRILHGEGKRGWRWLGIGVWMYLALAFRHDGVVPVIMTAVGLLIYFVRKKRSLVRPLAWTVASVFALNFLVVNGLAFTVLHVERNPAHTAFGTPMYLLAAVINDGCDIDPQDQALLERVMPLSDWAATQNPPNSRYTVDHVSREWGVPGKRIFNVDRALGLQYCRLAIKYLFRYPGVVLRAFFTANSIAWEITTPPYPDAESEQFSYDLDTPEQYEPDTFDGFAFTGFSSLTIRYAHFLETTPILRDVLVRGGVPLLCLLFGSLLLWRKRRRAELLACLPICVTHLTQLIGLCAQLQRYILPIRMWMVFFVLYACLAPSIPVTKQEPCHDDPIQEQEALQ